MSFPRYESYKDSGVEWLGEVPEHWEIVRLANLFRLAQDQGNADLPILQVSIHDGVSDRELGEEELDRKITRSDDRSKYIAVNPGDLVYNMMRAWQGGFGTVRVFGMVSPAYVVARPIVRFLTAIIENQLRTPMAVEEMRRHSQGVTDFRLRLYWEEFKSLRVTLPQFQEQKTIADFLDRETAKLDALIAEQQRLIELLKEKRQALISHAVTKGLNPDAPMKDSGIEWLGEVPEYWEVQRVKSIISEPLMYGANEAADDDNPDNPRFVRITDITENGHLRDDTFRSLPPDVAAPYILADGDVLLARSGATVGKSFIYQPDWGKCCFAGYLIRVKLNPAKMLASFFYAFCQTTFYWQFINGAQIQATIQNVSAERYVNLRLPCPPTAEQSDIAAFLDRETVKLDALTAEAKTAITLLHERRTALISATVTGKIDVRGFASDSTH